METHFTTGLIGLASLFAIWKENMDSESSYSGSFPKKGDTREVLFGKLGNTLKSNRRAIKWRRCLIYSVAITLILFLFVLGRIPTPKEVVLFVLIIYIVIYIGWMDFVDKVSDNAEKTGKNIIKILNK